MATHDVEGSDLEAFLARFGNLRSVWTTGLDAEETFAAMEQDIYDVVKAKEKARARAPAPAPQPVPESAPEASGNAESKGEEVVPVIEPTLAPAPPALDPPPRKCPSQALASILARQWSAMEASYVQTGLKVFRSMRWVGPMVATSCLGLG
jgi:hypothetical protein